MDIGKSIGFVFEDKDWITKVLIGGIVSLIPIVNLAALGYALRTLQNVGAGKAEPLPQWDDFGDYFVRGLVLFVGGLIYALPLIVVAVMTIALSSLTDSRALGAGAEGVISVCVAVLACLQLLLALAVSVWTPAAAMNYAATDEFAALFRFDQIWGLISGHLGDYIVALLVYWLVSMVAFFVGVVLCLVGTIFTSFIATLIFAHLLGQVLSKSREPAPAAA